MRRQTRVRDSVRGVAWPTVGLFAAAILVAARAVKRPDLAPWTMAAIPVVLCSAVAVAGVVLCLRLSRAGMRRRREMEDAVRDWRTLACAALCSTAIAGVTGLAAMGVIMYLLHRRTWETR